MKRLITSAVVAVMLIAVATCAYAWPTTTMQSTGTTETLLLAPSASANGGAFVYTYDLTNQTTGDYITGFALAFPTSVPVTGLTAITAPDGWDATVREISNKIEFRLTGLDSFSLAPSQTKSFGFTSTFAPGSAADVFASSQDSFGWSGMTYGPVVPEPAGILALLTGVIGVTGLKLRRK